MLTAERYHDISCGHRVVGHENKCRHLHGHNYRVHFVCTAANLDHIGRVIDFSIIKEKLYLVLSMSPRKHWQWLRFKLNLSNASTLDKLDDYFGKELSFIEWKSQAEHALYAPQKGFKPQILNWWKLFFIVESRSYKIFMKKLKNKLKRP